MRYKIKTLKEKATAPKKKQSQRQTKAVVSNKVKSCGRPSHHRLESSLFSESSVSLSHKSLCKNLFTATQKLVKSGERIQRAIPIAELRILAHAANVSIFIVIAPPENNSLVCRKNIIP